jgi:threonyl-tRNA synthetase
MGNQAENSHVMSIRHSLAHLLAATVVEMYPGAKNAIGPAIDDGFYQDFETPTPISDEDLPKIEARMREILKTWGAFTRKEVGIEEARKQFDWNPYKKELAEEFAEGGKQLTFYTSGEFIDLCRGGHVEDAKEINPKAFKLTKVSGAYWRGDQNKQQLQRVYGVAFETPDDLKQYQQMVEEAKKRDHRKLGQELDLFVFSDRVGSGLPLFTPRGTVLRDELSRFAESLRHESGFQRVSIPHITKTELYKVSGHWDKFGDELFLVKSQETSDEFALKPMNCPHHNELYASRPRSYRDLPIKYFETTTVYRDEKTGELGGLSRVRSISQDDSHAYCMPEQVGEVVGALIADVQTIYTTLGMSLRARLSFRDDGKGYLGSDELWQDAQKTIRFLAEDNKLDFFEAEGEAAFYGPKIDFMATDALGREHQVATVQLDFVQPERFKLEYVDHEGVTQMPVMVHCALLGSIERFLSVYIEHVAGKFPVWVAPEQVRLLTVNQEQATVDFANKVAEQAKTLGLRLSVDASNESVGKKIRAAELAKVPYSVVIGEKEIETGQMQPRIRKDMEVSEQHEARTVEEFLKTVANEAKSRVNKTSL